MTVYLESDRADLSVGGLPWPGRSALTARAWHRERNRLKVQSARQGGRLTLDLNLPVQAPDRGAIPLNRASLQHKLDALLARSVPLTLNTETYSGDAALDLHALRIWGLSTRTTLGNVRATLPERQSGPLTLVTVSGDVTLHASPAWRAPALRVNTESGDVTLDLGAARSEAVNIGTRSGDVTGTLPRADHASVTTGSGNLSVTVPEGASGTLDLRSEGGKVTLRLPPGLAARLRFTERTHLRGLPRTAVRQGNVVTLSREAGENPDLDLFLDADSVALAASTSSETPSPEGASYD